MIIESTTTDWWRATLEETEEGVLVVVFKRSPGGPTGTVLSEATRDTLDCPFHVACQRVEELLNQLGHPIHGRGR